MAESIICDCGADVPVDRFGEHRNKDCLAAPWSLASFRAALRLERPAFTPRPGTRYA